MPEQPPFPCPEVRRFNAALETFDACTLGRFDRVTSLSSLLHHAAREFGVQSGMFVLLEKTFKELETINNNQP